MEKVQSIWRPEWLNQALGMVQPVQIRFMDAGWVTVYPVQQRYYSSLSDEDLSRRWDADVAQMQFWTSPPPPQVEGQSVAALCWSMALQHACQQLQRQPLQRFQRVRLTSWPDLPNLPKDEVTPTARICALLALKPTTISLVPLMLKLPVSQVECLLEALRLKGHVQILRSEAVASQHMLVLTPPPVPCTGLPPETKAASSLIQKLWQRLGLGAPRKECACR